MSILRKINFIIIPKNNIIISYINIFKNEIIYLNIDLKTLKFLSILCGLHNQLTQLGTVLVAFTLLHRSRTKYSLGWIITGFDRNLSVADNMNALIICCLRIFFCPTAHPYYTFDLLRVRCIFSFSIGAERSF